MPQASIDGNAASRSECVSCESSSACILRISQEQEGARITEEFYPFDSVILVNRAPLESIITVKRGVIGVWMTSANGREAICGLYGTGQTIGWTGIFEEKPPTVVLKSLTDVTICKQTFSASKRIMEICRSEEAFHSIVRKDLSTFLLTWTFQGSSLGNRLLRLLAVIALYTADGDPRLEEINPESNQSYKAPWLVTFRTTHDLLAHVLHSNRAAITRAMKSLKEKGLIEINYRKISVDMIALPLFDPEMDFPVEMLSLFKR